MEYKVVQGDISEVSEYRLEAQVNRLMQEGWKPKGGVSYMSEGHDNYLQAMECAAAATSAATQFSSGR